MSLEARPPDPAAAAAPKDGGGAGAPPPQETNTLWVGNLPPHTSDADVMAAFAPHGALDCATTRAGSRSYAFTLFRAAADARAALGALQGAKVNGATIRNEFARPARAVRNLWVGGISPSLSKEELEEEFLKFGKIEGFSFFRDRNSAYVDFYKLEDAISAHRALNMKVFGGEELCVDFQRSKGRAEWFEASNFNSRVSGPLGSLPQSGEMRIVHGSAKVHTGVRMREAQPTNVLWVGFPNTFKINEEALRRAMATHGDVTKIKVFPTRQYAFVEFSTIQEASNAKKNLDGRLFNDHRIQILFSNSELAPHKLDNATHLAGIPRSEMFYNEGPNGPPNYLGPREAFASGSFGGPGENALSRSCGSQGFDPRRGRSGYFDFGGVPSASGILPAPEPCPPFLNARGASDAFDPRETKRMRLDAYASDADPYDIRAGNEGRYPTGFSHPDGAVCAGRSLSPVIRVHGSVHRTPRLDHYWSGSIAKGGAHVCRARCVPIGNGFEVSLPDIVNCSARTGLDMLTKHYADASGFDIAFFLPDSEDDFASYTEFLRYLGSKSRAGVVKVDARTTLFLVPPSDFLTNVLQVDGPERLYGVVLHIRQISTNAVDKPQLTGLESQSYYDEGEAVSTSQRNYSVISHNDNHRLDADYRGSLREDSSHHLGQIPARSRANEDQSAQPALTGFTNNQTAVAQGEVSLRPDILATLAKLLPSIQSTAPGIGQVPLSSTDRPVASTMHGASMVSQGLKHENQAMTSIPSFEQLGHLQHSGQHFSKQGPVAHLSNYGNMLSAPEHSAQTIANHREITLNLPPPPPTPTMLPGSSVVSSQGGNCLPSQSQQHYQPEQYYVSQSNYGLLTTSTASNVNLPAPPPPQLNHRPLPANNQMGNLAPSQHATALPSGAVSSVFSSQGQQQQAVVAGAAHAAFDEEERKKRIKATLDFAARLLQDIHREPQGPGNQP